VTVFLAGKDHDAYVQKLQDLKSQLTSARALAGGSDLSSILVQLSLIEDQLRTLSAAGMPSCHAELTSDQNIGVATITDAGGALVPSCGVSSGKHGFI
jgi:hypothetical protein